MRLMLCDKMAYLSYHDHVKPCVCVICVKKIILFQYIKIEKIYIFL